MKRIALLLILTLLSATGCRRTDVRTAEYSLPPGISQANTRALLAELNQLDPANPAFSATITNQTLTVVYDSMILARKNIEHILEKYESNPKTP